MRSSIRLGRIAGIEIGVHYSWIFIFTLVVWSLAQGFFPQTYPGWDTAIYWTTGILAATLLFVSVLLHELAHSLVARSRGMPVHSITLFIFGGMSNIEREAEKPKVEFAMAIVGPLTSLALAGVFWGVSQTIENEMSPLAALLGYLTLINIILGIFNLLPGFPLDGGRILRSVLWSTTGDLIKATNIAAMVGRFLGWALIALGVFQMFAGNFMGGLWLAFIGWFISSAADASRREVTLRERLSGAPVRDVMYASPETVDSTTTVAEVVWDIFRQRHRHAVPIRQNNHLVGIVTITDIKELPQDKWAETPVAEIMTREPLYSVAPEDDLNLAMGIIARHDINQVLVISQGQLVGILSRADIISHLHLSQELEINRRRTE
ncbi:site-2 protease family protein [Chloroflexota bacterium]